MKRIALFLATNLAVLLLMSMTFRILGLDRMLASSGMNFTGLLVMAAIIGMGGAFISLLMSKSMAKFSTGAHVIQTPGNRTEAWLVETVRRQAQQAGIGMPEVAVFNSPQPNAFATGADRNNALVAVSTGLLQNMNEAEVEAVLGHEISHVANGDMVTLTLIQGVVNTFVFFLARVVGMVVDRALSSRSDDEYQGPGIGYWVVSMVAEVVFGVLAMVIVMWFSRHREFRADAGGAKLAGREKMIAALESLRRATQPAQLPAQLTAFGINGGTSGFARLFMSHPPLEERIAALRQAP